uniref:Protein kinase domain-containing protein n=1 Tax=Arion vulgaris TaxID=1028688 RepID=A0A0B7A0H9_9EUPU
MPETRRRNYWIQQSVKDESFDSKYALGQEVGRGRSSLVYTCERRGLSRVLAVKIVRKNLNKKVCMADIGILLGLEHENLVRLQEIFESRTQIFIIQELAYGGQLFDRIASLNVYTEIFAGRAVKDIVSGINYLHNCGYILKNLKPENLLYATISEDSRLLIADFAMSSVVGLEVDMSSVCGSPIYTAPEVLKGVRCGKPGDMWSVGVIIYILLCGYEPFSSENPSQLFKKILKGQYEFFPEHWENISLNAQDVIKKLLVLEPVTRIPASAVLRSIWVQGSVPKNVQLGDVVMRMKNFNERRKDKMTTNPLEVHTIHPNTNPRFLLCY